MIMIVIDCPTNGVSGDHSIKKVLIGRPNLGKIKWCGQFSESKRLSQLTEHILERIGMCLVDSLLGKAASRQDACDKQ